MFGYFANFHWVKYSFCFKASAANSLELCPYFMEAVAMQSSFTFLISQFCLAFCYLVKSSFYILFFLSSRDSSEGGKFLISYFIGWYLGCAGGLMLISFILKLLISPKAY